MWESWFSVLGLGPGGVGAHEGVAASMFGSFCVLLLPSPVCGDNLMPWYLHVGSS